MDLSENKGEHKVYFIRRTDGVGPIKIGCTTSLYNRLIQINTSSHHQFEVIASFYGDFFDEKKLHDLLSAHRIKGEWYAPSDEVMSLIEDAKSGKFKHFTPISERNKIIFEMLNSGATYQKVADEFGVTKQRIRQVAEKLGIEPRRTGRYNDKVSKEDAEKDAAYIKDLDMQILTLTCKLSFLRGERRKTMARIRSRAFYKRECEKQ